MGDGARRLFARRYGMGLPASRPSSVESLSLERRWIGGHLGSASTDLLRRRLVERARSDLEREAIRTDRQRRQPWRGCEGILLLPGFDADAFVHEVPLQVPTG